MDEKKTFGEYIRKKRLEAGLTQKELAQRLYVTESTVSKWERALSYPDVSMVTAICRELGISEHEFFTACDDDNARLQQRAAETWRRVTLAWRWFFAVSYGIALVTCFICDLAIFHALDWFWIVLTSLGLAFCFTNLPFRVRRERIPVCLGGATLCLLLLLLACWAYVGGYWLGGSIGITLLCLALPWGAWAIWRFYGKHVPPLTMALLSVWVFGLLAVIWLFAGGSWLLSIAYPITGVSLVFVWAAFACFYWLPVGPWLKAGVCVLLVSFIDPVFSSLCARVISEQEVPRRFRDYFAWGELFVRQGPGDFWINILILVVLLAVAAVLLAVGCVMEVRRRKRTMDK